MNIDKALQLALEYYQNGSFREAEQLYRKVLKKNPKNPDALNNMGLSLQGKGQLVEAIPYFQKAVKIKPDSYLYHYNLGNVFKDTRQLDQAIQCYQKAVQMKPDLAEAYNNLGIVFQEKGQFDEAIRHYQKALNINPKLANTYNNLGFAFLQKGHLDEAVAYCKKALQLNPNLPDAYNNIGNIFRKKEQLDEAITCYQKTIQLNPYFTEAYNNIGSAFQDKGHLDEAIICYQKALQRNPNLVDTYNNLGVAFNDSGKIDEAINYYQKALQIDPMNAEAHFNMSFTFLLSGNFKKGWKEYEWRLKLKDSIQREFSQPKWEGSDVRGKAILLYAEQGLGDTIQFVRYVPMVAKRGLKVIVECHKELTLLLQNIEGADQIIAFDEQLPEFDVHGPLLNLPLVFDTALENIPAKIPYITANPNVVQKWQYKVQKDNSKLKIGLVWSGSPKFKRDRFRSCSLEIFSHLSQLKDITFYSLQKGEASEQAKNPHEGMRLLDYTEDIQDFSETAALIENLDLIISVDTAVAHLAGALGKPVWTLIPFAPDWRWLLNREDSPWYPTMRLFRQPSPGNWKPVIENIVEELKTLLRF